MIKKIVCCLTLILILCTLVSCKATPYKIKDYLNELSLKSGIASGEDIDETVSSLIKWNVIDKSDVEKIEDNLNYGFLEKTLNNLINDGSDIKQKGLINKKTKENDLVDKEDAKEIIDKVVEIINNKEFVSKYNYKTINDYIELDKYYYDNNMLYVDEAFNVGDTIYLDNDDLFIKVNSVENDHYKVKELSFEEVYEEIEMEDTYEINFDDVEDIPGGILENNDTAYINESRDLLASSNISKVFSTDGFRVSYSFKKNGIDARISKNIKGINTFFDISISDIKPSYKWKYTNGKIEEAYLKVNYNSVSELGCSVGKYNNLYLDFKDKDSSSFLNGLKSIIKTKDDEVEATIKICEIKTPIPQIPTAYFNIDVYARIYTTGKVEIVFSNSKELGFECRNGSIRFIDDGKKDTDFIIGGSSKATVGINFNIESVKKRLMDVEVDAGIRAAVSSTLHLFNEDGKQVTKEVDYPYSAIDEIAKENNDVKVCGDVSLNWVLDLKFNTSKTLLAKYGLSKTKTFLDNDNQLFKNKTHLENGVFVDKCTRKNRLSTPHKEENTVDINKIVLSKYSAVVNLNETYEIPIRLLPSGYTKSDLKYLSSQEDVAEVNSSGVVFGKKMGACEIKVSTNDNKYSASINILVSSG